ncbi:tRNA (N6-isopentenyl adenosine(37)-C2)-methylthiotransferase MiaB [Thermodesulfobacteriota bacterium]
MKQTTYPGIKKQYYIATMGCQMNEYDSDHLSRQFISNGYSCTGSPDEADIIIINTCSVREKAEQKAFSMLGRMKKLKKKNPDILLGFMGCIAQQEGKSLLKKYPELDIVIGTRGVSELSKILDRVINYNERVCVADLLATPGYLANITDNSGDFFKGRIKSYLSIMEGCNNFCSYCIVPYVRGREISRPPEDIMNEARDLVKQGVKEITLLGQNVNSYSSGKVGKVKFPELLKMLGDLRGLKRLRFTTSHPKDLSSELIDSFKKIDILCPHIHLPFQSGSNKILKLMNRKYTIEDYIDLVMRLRGRDPYFAVTSDVIVGFPGETSADFKNTLDLIKKIEFDNLFSFKYSDRKGTKASEMPGKVAESEKAARLKELQELQKEKTLLRNRMLEGKIEEILVDGLSRRGTQYTGRTKTNKIINFNSDISIIGDLVNVNIKRAFINSLKGDLLHN